MWWPMATAQRFWRGAHRARLRSPRLALAGCALALCPSTAAASDDTCSGVRNDLFVPLTVYFFTTLAVVLGTVGWFYLTRRGVSLSWIKRAATRQSTDGFGGYDDEDGGSTTFDRAGEFGKEAWAIASRELRFGPRIGVGNVGEVYRGTFRGRTVAIKKLLGAWYTNDDMVERFREEIVLMSTMNHGNVLSFVGAVMERDAGNICLVTELCERGTLSDVLKSPEPLSWPRRLKMARDVALGMDYLHTKAGVIQRDLKTENLLVSRDFEVKVADFGLSRTLNPGQMQTYCGTPATMAPEVVRQEPYTEKADVFSFGIIMWELLTREAPYPGTDNGLGLAFAVANEGRRPLIPAYCPQEWGALMVRCWDEDPAARPTFDEIQRLLFKIQDGMARAAVQGGGGRPGGAPIRSKDGTPLPSSIAATLSRRMAAQTAALAVGASPAAPTSARATGVSTAAGTAVSPSKRVRRRRNRDTAAGASKGVADPAQPQDAVPGTTRSKARVAVGGRFYMPSSTSSHNLAVGADAVAVAMMPEAP